MFAAWCPRCVARVLLTTRRLRAVEATRTGRRAVLECWCGAPVVDDLGGPPVDPGGAGARAAGGSGRGQVTT